MSVAAKLATFTVLLAALFGGGAAAGGLIDPGTPFSQADGPRTAGHGRAGMNTMGGERSTGSHRAMSSPVRGLAVAENGTRLVVEDAELDLGRTQQLRFRIVDDRGRAVRGFDVENTKKMHLIVVRRDATGFQHVHPTMRQDGTWSTPLRLADAGSYRMFADFSYRDTPTTLAADLRVDGRAELASLPSARAIAKSDGGYDVRLESGVARAGEESELRFIITRHGQAVQVQRYLGADGHLVALREGDLGYLHVHPVEAGHAENDNHDDSVGFEATFPTAGSYRLFLQFQHEGHVQTVAFTQEVR
jgi:hypothetical protein